MKRDLQCVSPQDTVLTAAQRMRDEDVGFLPVCDASKKVLGTITDRDLTIRVLADGRAAATAVSDVMTRQVVACRPEDDLRVAEELMSKHHKSRMMCLDANGQLVGIISLSDVAQKESGTKASQTLRDVSQREARP
jgi:CBS domain-containing protein